MTIIQALKIVKQYQAWRRDNDDKYKCPKNPHEAKKVLFDNVKSELSDKTILVMEQAIFYFRRVRTWSTMMCTHEEYGIALDELIQKTEESLK